MVALIVTEEEIERMQRRYDTARRDKNHYESMAMLYRMELAGAHQRHDFAHIQRCERLYHEQLDKARDATNEMAVWARKIDALLNG